MAAALGVLLVGAPVALGQTADFTPAATSPEAAETAPRSVAVGDFNGDGKQDLVVAHEGSANLTIMLGQGGGDFAPAPTGPETVGAAQFSVAVGDFNGDGKQDLATADFDEDRVSILMGDGTGNFTAAPTSPEAVGDQPLAVVVGDFNGDGKQDLATANALSDNVTILLGNGAGDFAAAATSPEAVGDAPNDVKVGDFNGDGRQDLATANAGSNNVTVLLGNGGGDFTAAPTSPEPVMGTLVPTSLAVGAFDGDGKQDLAVVTAGGGFEIFFGDGTGNLIAADVRPAGSLADSVAVGDFNGDGKQDLVSANQAPDNVTIRFNDGLGHFAAGSAEAVGGDPVSVAVGDFDGDGKADLATANRGSNNVTVLINQTPDRTNANFSPAGTSPEAVGNSPASVVFADFNLDGRQDAAAANALSSDVSVLLGDASGNFTARASREATGSVPFSIVAGDFNGDGRPDLATANQGDDNVTIMLGSGAGDFTAAATSPEAVGNNPVSLAVGDFNGDGRQDLASADLLANGVTILIGAGNGNFTAAGTSPETVGDFPAAVAVGDFNRDGRQDIATANRNGNNVTILLGDGTGNFTAAATGPETVGSTPRAVAVGDFNRDGKPDLATANSGSDNVTILLGDGTGNFTAAAGSPEGAGDSPIDVKVGDVNADGKQDLATANAGSDDVTILIGDGTGNFTAAPSSPEAAGDGATGLAAADLNRDGKTDLATADGGTNTLTILLADDPAVAVDDTKTVTEDTATGLDVHANDTDDAVRDKIVSLGAGAPAHGGVTITNGGNDVRYTPDADYCGPASFTYTLASGSEAAVAVTVDCVDDPAVAVDDSEAVTEDGAVTPIDVRANDTDVDATKDKIASVDAAAAHGSVAITNGGDDLAYAPTANFCGSASFTYTLTGGGTAAVAITVNCVDDAPVAARDVATVAQDSAATAIDALANDTDIDGGPKRVASVGQPGHGSAAVAAGGTGVSYTPAAGYCNSQPGGSPDSFTYTLESGSQATVAVTVRCVPRLALSRRRVMLVRGRVVVRLSCRGVSGQRCGGTLTLKPATRRSSSAAAGRARFRIPTGRSAAIKIKPSRPIATRLRRSGRTSAQLTARMTGDGATRPPLKRKITIHAKR